MSLFQKITHLLPRTFGLVAASGLLAVAQPHALAVQAADSIGVLLARGDTAGAIAAYEQLIRSRSHDAELHYRVGLLYMSRVEPGTDVSADRRRAIEHLPTGCGLRRRGNFRLSGGSGRG